MRGEVRRSLMAKMPRLDRGEGRPVDGSLGSREGCGGLDGIQIASMSAMMVTSGGRELLRSASSRVSHSTGGVAHRRGLVAARALTGERKDRSGSRSPSPWECVRREVKPTGDEGASSPGLRRPSRIVVARGRRSPPGMTLSWQPTIPGKRGSLVAEFREQIAAHLVLDGPAAP